MLLQQRSCMRTVEFIVTSMWCASLHSAAGTQHPSCSWIAASQPLSLAVCYTLVSLHSNKWFHCMRCKYEHHNAPFGKKQQLSDLKAAGQTCLEQPSQKTTEAPAPK